MTKAPLIEFVRIPAIIALGAATVALVGFGLAFTILTMFSAASLPDASGGFFGSSFLAVLAFALAYGAVGLTKKLDRVLRKVTD